MCYAKNMEKISLKSSTKEARTIVKKQIINMLKKGIQHQEIADTLSVKKTYVDHISSQYRRNGKQCLSEKKRGRKKGEKRQLSPEQEKEIQSILIDKYPNQLKMNFMLWTRAAVCQLVMDKYGITITQRNMSEYLKRWGMTCQRPTKKAYFQDNVKLNKFMHETYPDIVKKAQKEDAEIYWGDETGINNQAYHVRGYSPKGKTPEIPSYSKIEKINMISAITNKGTCRFMCYSQNMTQQIFIEFMEHLVKDADRKVLFIVDNLKVHHGKLVEEWLEHNTNEIELFFIPPYSPEANPDEY